MLELLFRYSSVPVDVNVQNKYKSSPLFSAVHTRSIELVRFLLDKGPDDMLKDQVNGILILLSSFFRQFSFLQNGNTVTEICTDPETLELLQYVRLVVKFFLNIIRFF
jgi:hypothetical protein